MRAELERIEIPGAAEAEERAAGGRDARVRRAAARCPHAASARARSSPSRSPSRSSPPCSARPAAPSSTDVRRAVGIEGAKPALFSLPAPGRLLVHSDAGVWVAQPDGSRRLLGPYEEGSWSPLGRYVVATRANELVTLEREGTCAGRSPARASGSRAGAAAPPTRGSPT